MADRPSARDDERLPWLEPTEGERARRRKPVSRGVLVGLLAAFFGIGLAVAFSLGYRIAQPSAQAPARAQPEQLRPTASVQVPLKPPAPEPKVEPAVPEPAVVQPVSAEPNPTVVAKPAIKKTPTVRHKAKPRHVRPRKPILRPFVNVKRHTAVRAPVRSAPPVRYVPPVRVGPKGRLVQLGAYSTVRQADSAYRSIVWRYPYLAKKPKLVVTTPPIGGYRYYRLQMGTDSQAQSVVICQYLQARGQSCIVLY